MSTSPRALTLAALLTSFLAVACSSAPAASVPSDSSAPASSGAPVTVNVTLTNAGCVPDRSSAPAGAVAFSIVNQGGEAVSEAELMQGDTILGEKEGLVPGLSGGFTLQLQPGSYVIYCPGATTPRTPFEVTAAAPSS